MSNKYQKYHSAYLIDAKDQQTVKEIPSVYIKKAKNPEQKLLFVSWDYEPDLMILLHTAQLFFESVRWENVERVAAA